MGFNTTHRSVMRCLSAAKVSPQKIKTINDNGMVVVGTRAFCQK